MAWAPPTAYTGRSGNGQRFDASGLSRHGIHDHGRRVNSLATRHIQADALNRNPTFGNTSALGQVGVEVLRHLIGSHSTGTTHRFLNGGAHFGIKCGQGILNRFDRHTQVLRAHMVELLLEVTKSGSSALLHIVQNRTHQVGGFGSAHCGARHRSKQFGTGQFATTKVNNAHDILTHNVPS